MDKSIIDKLVAQVIAAMPQDLQVMQTDLQKHMRATLSAIFAKMDLVSREEFDVQAALLQRTRAQLDKLEATLTTLEACKPPPSPRDP